MKKNKKSLENPFAAGRARAEPSREAVLELFEQGGRAGSLSLRTILDAFGAGRARGRELEGILAGLVGEGRLVRLKGPAYSLPQGLKNVRGHIRIQRQGMGFVRPQRGGGEIYIHPGQTGGAWDGDLVLVCVLPGRTGKNPEGRVLEVLERRQREILAEILPQSVREEGVIKRLARPLDSRLPGYLLLDLEGLDKKPRQGDLVLAQLPDAPGNGRYSDGVTRARAHGAFGEGAPLNMYERLVKTEHDIATRFPSPVLALADRHPPDPDPDEELAARRGLPSRRDLRHVGFVTIDSADARDFDDAVYVEKSASGHKLLVAIADVAHYVHPGGELDAEALKRGNSCYFPASVEPMLPPALSNGLCSLRPGAPRLAVVAELAIGVDGETQKVEFYRALIQSRARLTYTEAQAALDASQETRLDPETSTLLPARDLALALLKRRARRGALNFDLPEPRAELDARGNVAGLALAERLFSHSLIEEFMIAANEAVAAHLAGCAGNLSFLYRVHPAPDADKLAALAKTLAASGLDAALPENPGPGDMQRLLEAARGTPREFVTGRLVLRSLMQAAYSPTPGGHFGLASAAYAHFTSPIRRYADLTVHRALLSSLGYPGHIPTAGDLAEIAASLNEREREAVAAERKILKICAALYLREYIGEEFQGVISGFSAFGIFVELSTPPCEGFVRLESLSGGDYLFDHERQTLLGRWGGARLTLGQPLALRLVRSDPLRQEITFEPAASEKVRKQRNKNKRAEPRGNKKRRTLPKGSVRRKAGRD